MASVISDDDMMKREMEDSPGSPDNTETQDSDPNPSETQSGQKQQKVTIFLKPTGNAPLVKNKKWNVERNSTLVNIMEFLKHYMKLDSSASVFLYVNQSFAPSPDYEVGTLYDCFEVNGKLVLHYSTSPAWG